MMESVGVGTADFPDSFGMLWMSPSQMVLQPGAAANPTLPSEYMQLDPSNVQLENPYYPMAVPPSYESVPEQPMEVEGFLMMQDYEPPYCNQSPKYITTSTQTTITDSGNIYSRMNPVRRPGLKLQTPIAYKCDTDLSVIPIQKEGMGVCDNCGAIGVKHAFYTKNRNYCSMACAKSGLGLTDVNGESKTDDENSQNSPAHRNSLDKKLQLDYRYLNGSKLNSQDLVVKDAVPMYLGYPSASNIPTFPPPGGKFNFPQLELPDEDSSLFIPNKKINKELANTYQWKNEINEADFNAAPVSCFKNVPMADCWENITVGMKVEVENRDCEDYSESFSDSFWVATVLRVAGYKALLRYEGFGHNNVKDFWVDLCSKNVHPVGWCAIRGKPLIPPKSIQHKYKDWKEFLVKRLTGARTLPSNFYSKVQENLKSRFRIGLNVEVVDKNKISQVRVATVKRIIGKRLHVEYCNAESDDNGSDDDFFTGFWCHEDSPLIHPVGWASRVGHKIDATEEYIERCESGLIGKDDALDELFTAPFQTGASSNRDSLSPKFREGMKLEAVDPLNLGSICVATVMKVLRDDYLMIRIDSYPADERGSDWFCYHSSSPCIFPAGFSRTNSINLIPPQNYEEEFIWENYIVKTKAVLAPESLFKKKIPNHGFVEGMRLEATDLMDPRLVCVATVARVVGRLLKIHFNGWEEEYDQWLDCESPDIYPVGWCAMVSHKLEGPRSPLKSNTPCAVKKRQRKRLKTKTKVSSPMKKPSASVDEESESSKLLENNSCSNQDEGEEEVQEEIDNRGDGSSYSIAISSGVLDGHGNGALTKEPETGKEPSGPDQSLPVPTNPSCNTIPTDSTSVDFNEKNIPRIIDSAQSDKNESETGELNPLEWTIDDVVKFLKVNDCSSYCENFIKMGTNGKDLMSLTKDELMDLIGFKIGPTLKIYHLIQQLKTKWKSTNFKKNYLS